MLDEILLKIHPEEDVNVCLAIQPNMSLKIININLMVVLDEPRSLELIVWPLNICTKLIHPVFISVWTKVLNRQTNCFQAEQQNDKKAVAIIPFHQLQACL